MIEVFKSKIGTRASEQGLAPLSRWLDGKLVAAEVGSLSVEFDIREDFSNPAMILHGGVAAAMMDEVMGMTVYSLGKDAFFASVNLNVDYLRPAKVGETVLVKSEIIKDGHTIVHAECVITNQEGKIVAKSVSNLVRTNFGFKKA